MARALRQAPAAQRRLPGRRLRDVLAHQRGVVADDADGLVVPTIFDADTKDEAEIAAEWEALAAEALTARSPHARLPAELSRSRSGSGYEGCAYLPVINAGQAANLGIGSPRDGAIWRHGRRGREDDLGAGGGDVPGS